jgi:hypothetical protein
MALLLLKCCAARSLILSCPLGCAGLRGASTPCHISTRCSPALMAAECERHVVAAESERIADGVLVVAGSGRTGHDVQQDREVQVLEVARGRHQSVSQGLNRQDRLDGARGTDGVSDLLYSVAVGLVLVGIGLVVVGRLAVVTGPAFAFGVASILLGVAAALRAVYRRGR